jgi:hypothetical protein
VLAGFLSAGLTEASQPPNIFFIFSGDHTPQAIGGYQGNLAML